MGPLDRAAGGSEDRLFLRPGVVCILEWGRGSQTVSYPRPPHHHLHCRPTVPCGVEADKWFPYAPSPTPWLHTPHSSPPSERDGGQAPAWQDPHQRDSPPPPRNVREISVTLSSWS